MPDIKPMVVGLFCGDRKPGSIEEFMRPFVDESIDVLRNGVKVNGHHIHIRLRCFICDSPARSFLKGMRYMKIVFTF